MAFFEWNDSYSVGVRELDAQHKQLIAILSELYDAMQSGKANDIMGQIINKLVNYTKTHFATEEKYMSQYGYPDLAAQQREHKIFTDKVIKFKEDFNSGRISMSASVTSFVKDWLISHISGTDKKYTSFFQSKGVS